MSKLISKNNRLSDPRISVGRSIRYFLAKILKFSDSRAKDLARWKALKAESSGMLSPVVYRELYRLARDAPDLDIIEIGGAAGAGSIALALGVKESGKRSGVIVAEKLEGGSRVEFGDRSSNQQIIEENFRKFGVLDQVRFFPHEVTMENGGEVSALFRSGEIAVLVHDADGRVDRDFFLFWPLLRDGCAIVIDDYADEPAKYRPVTPRHPRAVQNP
jgi:predicted O-methyltransferase YrrM